MINKKRVKEKRKRFNKNLTSRIIPDLVKRVPLIESIPKAIEQTEIQGKEAKRDKKISKIDSGIEHIEDNMENMGKILPILNPQKSIKKIDYLLSVLDDELRNNPDFHLDLQIDKNGKKTLNIIPKKKELKIKGKFKVKIEKLEGKKNFIEFINEKIKNGDSVTFNEDEIEGWEIEHPQFNYSKGKIKEIKILPQLLDKPKALDIEL